MSSSGSKGQFLLREVGRSLAYTVGAIGAAGVIGSSVGYYVRSNAEAELEREPRYHLAPHTYVRVGGADLHCVVKGRGWPVVVLDGSSGSTCYTWGKVQEEIAKHTTCVAFDRAGLGLSSPGPMPRTALQQSEELSGLLRHGLAPNTGNLNVATAGATGALPPSPVGAILVAHGSGGLSARLLARRHPEQLSGLVLLDSQVEGVMARVSEVGPDVKALVDGLVWNSWFLSQLARIGLVRVVMNLPNTTASLEADYRPEDRPHVLALTSTYKHRLTMHHELAAMDTSEAQVGMSDEDLASAAAQMRETVQYKGDTTTSSSSSPSPPSPLLATVVRHGVPDLFKPFLSKGPNPMAKLEAMEDTWKASQADLARSLAGGDHVQEENAAGISSRSGGDGGGGGGGGGGDSDGDNNATVRFLVAKEHGHQMPQRAPEVVVEAIVDMVRRVRAAEARQ